MGLGFRCHMIDSLEGKLALCVVYNKLINHLSEGFPPLSEGKVSE